MASRDGQRPNVVLILTDDQGDWTLESDELKTPNLDRLAGSGMRFINFFCASPVCSPARASIFTGQIPSQHGIHDWIRAGNSPLEQERGGALIRYLDGQITFTDILAQNGYACGLSGKWHLGDSLHPQHGFGFWRTVCAGETSYYNGAMVRDGQIYREPAYISEAITGYALEFLDQQAASDSPFYLSVHYTAPHSPWNRDQHPAAIFDDYYNNCPFDSIPDEPMHPWQINSAPWGRTPERRRELLSGYFTAVTAMDQQVGRLLDWLETNGLSENTLVIFTSDNGMNMGHHGIYGKGNGTFPQNMYDTSVKVPAIMAHPSQIAGGQTVEALLSHYDLMPTLLEYLGMAAAPQDNLPGKSFAGLLKGAGEITEDREAVVVYDEYGPVRMIRDREWKYVHRYPYGPHELYHLANDPGEQRNLIEEAAYVEKIVGLKAGLEDWFARFVNPAKDGRNEAVTGMGQLGPAGLAALGRNNFAANWFYLKDTK